jgi:lysophospholipase L1-like esterase
LNRFEQVSRPARGLIVVLGVIFASVLLLVAAEGAVRVRASMRFGNLVQLEDLLPFDPALHIRLPIPNTNVVLARTSHIKINSVGFRSPEISLKPTSPNTVRLAFLGASTTFCAETSSNEATWPYQVAAIMQQHYPGVKIDFINAAVPGYRMHDSLVRFEAQVRPYKPDIVFVYDGQNDFQTLTAAVAITQHLLPPRRPEGLIGGFLEAHSLLYSLAKKNIAYMMDRRAGANPNYKAHVDLRAIAQTYGDRVKALTLSIENAGALPVLVAFSPRLRRDQTPEEKAAVARHAWIYMPYLTLDQMIEGYDDENSAMHTVARQTGAVFLGNEFSIPGDSRHYADSVHFTDAGAAAMARRVTAILFTNPRINALIKNKEEGSVRPVVYP